MPAPAIKGMPSAGGPVSLLTQCMRCSSPGAGQAQPERSSWRMGPAQEYLPRGPRPALCRPGHSRSSSPQHPAASSCRCVRSGQRCWHAGNAPHAARPSQQGACKRQQRSCRWRRAHHRRPGRPWHPVCQAGSLAGRLQVSGHPSSLACRLQYMQRRLCLGSPAAPYASFTALHHF